MMHSLFKFPEDYIAFINELKDNELSTGNGYIELFPLDELEKINIQYKTDRFVPNFIAIGTNGAGVGIFINKDNKQIYSIPFVGLEESDAVLLANSFSEFIYKFENEDLEIF